MENIGKFLEYIFLGKGLTYYSGILAMVLGTYWFFRGERNVRRGIEAGCPASNARMIPWFRCGGLAMAVFGFLFVLLGLIGCFD